MEKKFRYLTLEDRKKIAEMWKAGAGTLEIAAAIKVSQKTIYRELDRGWDGKTVEKNLRRAYDPVRANDVARAAISERGRQNATKKEQVTA